jgi:hypothetical protein
MEAPEKRRERLRAMAKENMRRLVLGSDTPPETLTPGEKIALERQKAEAQRAEEDHRQHRLPAEETPEERRARLRALAKQRVQELITGKNVPMPGSVDTARQVRTGPRGGRYTEAFTRDGRPYRRYF